MHVTDAAGRRVSLLNDDASSYSYRPPPMGQQGSLSNVGYGTGFYRSRESTSPHTPELRRSDSYDSRGSNEPMSPVTPTVGAYDYRAQMFAPVSAHEDHFRERKAPPPYLDTRRSTSYEEDCVTPTTERPGKRYPCRYRDSHGCEKTFTTSGHASRHSKIHTSEKGVQCTHPGCPKKFTRADNMKQHLETHNKDKSRVPGAQRGVGRRSSASRPSGRRPSREQAPWGGPDGYILPPPIHQSPLPSPGVPSPAWDFRSMNSQLGRPEPSRRTMSNGLDALAMAVVCKEGR